MLNWVEYEKSFITLGPWSYIQVTLKAAFTEKWYYTI